MPIRILLYFAVHQRIEILKVCLQGIKRLQRYDKKRFEIIPFAVCSTQEESNVLLHFEIPHIIHPNQPLGEKKNAGLRAALTLEWDYLMELGSDDLLKNELLDLYYPKFVNGEMTWGLNACYFYEVGTHKVGIHENHYPIGAGRCFKRDVFKLASARVKLKVKNAMGGVARSYNGGGTYEMTRQMAEAFAKHGYGEIVEEKNPRLDFWTPTRLRALDGDSMNRLKYMGVEIECIETKEPYVLDIKSETNINPITTFPEIDYPILDHFKSEADAIRRLG